MSEKTLLFVVEDELTSRSLLISDFLEIVSSNFQKVVVVVPSPKVEYCKQKYERDNVVVDGMEENTEPELIRKLFVLMKYSIPAYEAKLSLMRTLFGQNGIIIGSWLVFIWPVMASWYLSRYRFWRNVLRRIYVLFANDEKCIELLKKHNVDVVYANYTSVFAHDFNLKLIKAAKRMDILTIGGIATWDNLYSKVFITQHTDFLTVNNELIKQAAVELGDFKEDTIRIIGIPGFDFYSKKELLLSREEFFNQIGADPDKKFIVFAGGLRRVGISYSHFFNYFDRLTKEMGGVQFYLRPHPNAQFDGELVGKYKSSCSMIFERRAPTSYSEFKLSEKDNKLLLNLLYHADLLIDNLSTIMIEACFLNTPIIVLRYSGDENRRYCHRPERDFEENHIKIIMKRKFCRAVRNDKELVENIKLYLISPNLDTEARRETAKEQMFITDGTSAAALAKTVVDVAGLPVARIS